MSGFDPSRSRVSSETMSEFLSAPMSADLTTVPGVGPSTIERLKEDSITTTYQLMGAFLRVCNEYMTSKERTDAFWYYLQAIKVPGGTRSSIVQAIAEKANIMIPGLYDEATLT
jgi:hypothetical protein